MNKCGSERDEGVYLLQLIYLIKPEGQWERIEAAGEVPWQGHPNKHSLHPESP